MTVTFVHWRHVSIFPSAIQGSKEQEKCRRKKLSAGLPSAGNNPIHKNRPAGNLLILLSRAESIHADRVPCRLSSRKPGSECSARASGNRKHQSRSRHREDRNQGDWRRAAHSSRE